MQPLAQAVQNALGASATTSAFPWLSAALSVTPALSSYSLLSGANGLTFQIKQYWRSLGVWGFVLGLEPAGYEI